MSDYHVPYGKSTASFTIPDDYHVDVIAPRTAEPASDLDSAVRAALAQPVGDVNLADFAGVQSVAIAISDKTRPIPHAAMIALLAHLETLNIASDAITLLIATGTHPPMTPDEFPKILPDAILQRYRVISHDCDDAAMLAHLGQTVRGTPVWANRHFVEADLRIVIGNLEPHQFMGFSGGVKGAAIGLAGRETINTNHAMMTDPASQLGRYADNPARQDVEEIGKLLGVHVALNAILNQKKQIVRVLFGDPLAVMNAGIPLVRELVEVPVSEPFDLVITSPGGHPKDVNLYQAQKALAHAARVTRHGGTVIIVAACSEGTGSAHYDDWIDGMSSHDAVIDRFAQEDFHLGPHKAFMISRDAVARHVILVSEMPDTQVDHVLLNPAPSIQAAVERALSTLPAHTRIGILPAANATIPVLAE